MAIPTLEDYLRFFLDAGIPALAAQKYALYFEKNRIRTEMVPHLTKQLLNEMGIDVLGDIFVILSHASDPNNCLCYNQQTRKNNNDSKADERLYKIKKPLIESRALVHRIRVSSRSDSTIPKSLVGRLEDVVFPDGKRIKSRFQFHEHESDDSHMVGKATFSPRITKSSRRLSDSTSSRVSRAPIFSRIGKNSERSSIFKRLG